MDHDLRTHARQSVGVRVPLMSALHLD